MQIKSRNSMVLLVVDTQKAITNKELYNFEIFEARIKALISQARCSDTEVIFVRHDDGAGHELTKGNEGFEIYEGFQPAKNEKIFDKNVNSPFRNTGLLEYLQSQDIRTVMIVGLQTDYCIDAAVKAGFEHGLRVIVPEYTNSTFDNQYMTADKTYEYYNKFMWNGRYAECISIEKAIELISQK